ncbi:unnamed protein product [Caenorhabditis nigoni]
MYYYYDDQNVLQGPYSNSALQKWFEKQYLPAGTLVYDQTMQPFPIEYVVNRSLKSRTKVMFHDDTFNLDKTNLDVTLHLCSPDLSNTTSSSEDFTQLEGGVDEVDFGRGYEYEKEPCFLNQLMINSYIEQRALLNRRRRFPDTYCPFENTWDNWVPEPIEMNVALRGAIHTHNVVQTFDERIISGYLNFLNIYPHPCQLCDVKFSNSKEMFEHFLSVIHIQRSYKTGGTFSYIDLYCARKIIHEVEMSYADNNFDFLADDVHFQRRKMSFFDEFDILTSFESLKSTVSVSQGVPLLSPPRNTVDTLGYVEAIVFFRVFQEKYKRIPEALRGRRFGPTGKTWCNYCKVEFDATFLESFPTHLFSEEHIDNALYNGVSRADMEYWLSFMEPLMNGNCKRVRHQDRVEVSLQESDFPLCYVPVGRVEGDFSYTGKDVQPVLNYVRNEIAANFDLLDDYKYRTTCRWCRTDLFTRNGVLRHILHDKCHLDRLNSVSNDDIRRLLCSLDIKIRVPLFRQSKSSSSSMDLKEKKFYLQRLRNVCSKKLNNFFSSHQKNTLSQLAARSFPVGLVNRCDLCDVAIDRVDAMIMHLSSEQHIANLIENPRISKDDVQYWLTIFNVDGRRSRVF